mmetsp:Transcript_87148/g.247358  ORF Transcript_87148/g.247358 Transcript_87148/m.247358 type:complete len:80 (+) Transcript_87148:541-780(+)
MLKQLSTVVSRRVWGGCVVKGGRGDESGGGGSGSGIDGGIEAVAVGSDGGGFGLGWRLQWCVLNHQPTDSSSSSSISPS